MDLASGRFSGPNRHRTYFSNSNPLKESKRLTTMKLLRIFTLCLLPLLAQTHHVDFSTVLIGADGKPMPNGDKKLTLGDVAGAALMSTLEEDKNSTGAEKYKLFKLAQKVVGNKGPFTVEDMALIKARIGKAYGPGVVGPAFELLDPALAGAAEKPAAK
jgi:hypothetical protein